jgi:LacI family transcriptional regulator
LFDRVTDKINAHKIVVDDYNGGYRATKHLIENGARKIAHIGGPQTINIYKNRQKGYVDALIESGIKIDKSLIFNGDMTKDAGIKAIKKFINNNKMPDAIFCANDTTALGVIIFLKEADIKVPTDIAIVGFSNEPFSEVVTPSISTIKQPGFLMGQKAAKLLINQISDKKENPRFETITMPTELIVRESSKS